jgi:para-nitrobenzyl esterase
MRIPAGAAAAVVLSVAMILSGVMPHLAAAQERTGEINVSQGRLQGKAIGGGGQFLGIPFAAPPVGALRWMPPAQPAAWTGTRDATGYGRYCAQMERGIFAMPGTDEDCLYLNVFTPTARPDGASKLPVMVLRRRPLQRRQQQL